MLRLLIITTLCLLAAAWDKDGTTCKKIGETDEHCHCYSDYLEDNVTLVYDVHCSHVRTLDQLKAILNVAKEGKNLHGIFYDLTVKAIPFDLFQDQHFELLHFEYGKVESFGDKPFQGLEDSLKRLTFYQALDKRRNDFNKASFSHLKNLEHLMINQGDLREIPDTWFNGGPVTLNSIDLETNKIATLGDNAFASLENLEDLLLFRNRIKTLKRSMFPKPANHLEFIELGFNRIEDLPSDIFSEMPKIVRINIFDNFLSTIDQATWQEILQTNNATVDLRENEMNCDKRLRWIYEHDLQHNIYGHCYMEKTNRWKVLNQLTLKDFESLE